jgi:hypothetical protein
MRASFAILNCKVFRFWITCALVTFGIVSLHLRQSQLGKLEIRRRYRRTSSALTCRFLAMRRSFSRSSRRLIWRSVADVALVRELHHRREHLIIGSDPTQAKSGVSTTAKSLSTLQVGQPEADLVGARTGAARVARHEA